MFLFIGYFSINTLVVYFIVIYGRLYRIFLSERARVFQSVQIIVRNNYVVKTRIINNYAQNVAGFNLKLYTNLTHPSLNFRFPTMIPDLDTTTTFRKMGKFSNFIISDFITTNQQMGKIRKNNNYRPISKAPPVIAPFTASIRRRRFQLLMSRVLLITSAIHSNLITTIHSKS